MHPMHSCIPMQMINVQKFLTHKLQESIQDQQSSYHMGLYRHMNNHIAQCHSSRI